MNKYSGVVARFLRDDERLVLSEERDMPLVIEAQNATDTSFLHAFLESHSAALIDDLATYGAVLLRGFDLHSDEDFEKAVLSIKGFRGIKEAFMSEEGRIAVDSASYVLHTNAVYKTGGTLYLGGFHSENYYNPDVPSYLCFFCIEPSRIGGETGLINTEKVYQAFSDDLKEKLTKRTFFVSKWLLSDVVKRYRLPVEAIEAICKRFDLPIIGQADDRFIVMYKPSIFEHPLTKKPALQINLFELPTLNPELRRCFLDDYQGKTWFWHRWVWRWPTPIFKIVERIYLMFASFFYSPKESLNILCSKIRTYWAAKKKNNLPPFDDIKVGSCFNDEEVKTLAQLLRTYYSSCLWKKGDVLLVDNRKVVHAGMPGSGPRLIRAMICNPIEMTYSFRKDGRLICQDRQTETVGFYTTSEGDNVGYEIRNMTDF